MSGSVVYLFADTNLLIQCRELDWSAWNEFDEVRLIVSSPVLREIDYRKNKGNDRVGNRARATSAMFREILNDEYKLVRGSGPCVKLSVESQHQYSKKSSIIRSGTTNLLAQSMSSKSAIPAPKCAC